ncbi:hypothetical protein MTR_8g099015 [Medicago truncatula]|uniref:Uncharacterized protein n=1 Tax=Medicago truncatula TaxID=3880 RepID=A0A072TW92_MEDTR|nr:hypothetical protein MTR_8g099015 [Medicago truncatula]
MSYTLPMVVKTGPDRPVEPIEPGTGLNSSPVRHENRKPNRKTGAKPDKIGKPAVHPILLVGPRFVISSEGNEVKR